MLLWSCKDKGTTPETRPSEPTLFTLMGAETTGIHFENTVENQKDLNIFKYRNFYNGGGVAIGDINNDGLADIYFTGNMVPNRLYLNKGNFEFEDISVSAGVMGNKPWSTGVLMVDVNNDGLLDIYVCNAGNMEGNNHDNDLYINNGDLTFTERAHEFGLADTGFTTHASFFDYDKDGDLDVYILNNSNVPVSSLGYAEQRDIRAQDWEKVPHIFRGVGDMLLRNDNGKFVDVSEEAGIYGSLIGFGLGVMVTDFNGDGYPDLYITNDFYERDYLYINQRDGTFTEEIKDWTSHLSLSAMGVDIADINNDGHNDIYVTEMLPESEQRVKTIMQFDGYNVFDLKVSKDFYQQYIQNTLQLSNGDGSFSEVAYYSGTSATDWSWAGLIFDMDNDGLKDIFVTNGINHDMTDLDFVDFFANEIVQKMALTGRKESIDSIIAKMPINPQPNFAFRNKGDITFENANAAWGFETPSLSNGVAYGDLDNDGDLDLVINNVNAKAFVYRNNATDQLDNNYLQLKFKGPEKNPFAIGTLAKVYFDGNIVNQELIPSRGFQSSVDYPMTLGLGKSKKLDSLRIVWPDNRTQFLTDVAANQVLELVHSDSLDIYRPPQHAAIRPLWSELDNRGLESHREDAHNDFDHEGLIYQKLSREGPSLAVADVNGDGHEDVFVGGSRDQAATLYLHRGNGKLSPVKSAAFEADKAHEDVAAAFFDADGDGDMDLVVGSGGNHVGLQRTYGPRLYLNDGQGNFTRSPNQLPSTFKNISTIAPHDFDQDGDIDLFIASRSVVGIYGVTPDHLLLENMGDGSFNDVTQRLAYDLKDAGMITDARWVDMDGDGIQDLVVGTDWDSPKIYRNSGRRLSKMDSSLDSLYGWWNSLEAADLDGDGDMDLILGNGGLNLHYRPSKERPMKLWINDYDGNGTIEQIVTLHQDGKDFPLHQKKELTGQLPGLKKQNLKAADYAGRTLQELFPKETIDRAIVKKVETSASLIATNEGGGKFSIKELPYQVQLSCVCDISCLDVDGDGNLDLMMAGNNFGLKPQFSRLDASQGHLLLGDGTGNFQWQDNTKSGFKVRDEVKYLKQFKDRDGKVFLIAAINDKTPKIFALHE